MTNILYTFFDAMVWFGRFIGVVFMIFLALLLLSFFVLQVFVLAGVGIGGLTLSLWIDNPPEFFKEFLASKVVTGG
jgi:hypothetical protein